VTYRIRHYVKPPLPLTVPYIGSIHSFIRLNIKYSFIICLTKFEHFSNWVSQKISFLIQDIYVSEQICVIYVYKQSVK